MKGIWGNLATGVIAGAFLCTSALATTVGTGQFNLDGSATGTTGGIMFSFAGVDNTAVNVTPDTGAFSDLNPGGTPQSIQALTTANGVTPGSSFDFKNWITLTDGIQLDAMSIPIPSFPVCGSGSYAVGYQCLVNAASPVVLTQTASGVSARLNVFGSAHFTGDSTLTPFVGQFNSPSTNYATIADFEAAFMAMGGIPPVSFAASFNTTAPSTVPEPGSMILLASGLLGFGLLRKRKAAR